MWLWEIWVGCGKRSVHTRVWNGVYFTWTVYHGDCKQCIWSWPSTAPKPARKTALCHSSCSHGLRKGTPSNVWWYSCWPLSSVGDCYLTRPRPVKVYIRYSLPDCIMAEQRSSIWHRATSGCPRWNLPRWWWRNSQTTTWCHTVASWRGRSSRRGCSPLCVRAITQQSWLKQHGDITSTHCRHICPNPWQGTGQFTILMCIPLVNFSFLFFQEANRNCAWPLTLALKWKISVLCHGKKVDNEQISKEVY